MVIHSTLDGLAVPIGDLSPYPRNPRLGDIDAIAKSLEINGQYRPIVANRRTNEVLAGNHTFKAAKQLGWTHVAVTWVDVDEVAAAKIVAVDNRANDLASYDNAALVELLKALPDLEGTLYDDDAMQSLVDSLEIAHMPAIFDDDVLDEAPPVPEDDKVVSRLGDLWQLGPHRVLVGDSTDADSIGRLMAGQKADCMWTDPPYGVNVVGGDRHILTRTDRMAAGGLTIDNDQKIDLAPLLKGFLAVATTAMRPGVAAYIAHPAGPIAVQFGNAIVDAGWSLRQQLVWVKDTFVLGGNDYHYKHEPIWMAYTPGGKGKLGRFGDNWYGDDKGASTFDVVRPRSNKEHPTMKPVELVAAMVTNSCPLGGIVYEPFGGSGSTLVAAHSLKMRARVSELDPKYADVICRRYQQITGDIPILESTGEAHDFTKE